jgi:hypothetical protein
VKQKYSVAIRFLFLGLAGCHGCGDDDSSVTVDAAADAPSAPACNPLLTAGLQGCDPGLKCTWIAVGAGTGQLGCVADGTVATGGSCVRGTDGATTGFDNCVAGQICVAGTCTDICGFDGSAIAGCEGGSSCARYDGLFANGTDLPPLGACHPTCNPVIQRRLDNQPCGAGKGCYLVTDESDTVGVCAPAGNVGHNADLAGTAFANSCTPGAQPRRKDGISTTLQCGGLCNANDVTSTSGSEGGLEIAGNALAKDNCQTSWGARPATDGTAGESCRYWWAREPFTSLGPYSNTVGWCFKHAIFQYDTNGDQMPDAPFPRCAILTTGDVVPPIGNPPHNDALYFWCVAQPSAIAPIVTIVGEPAIDRLTGWR